MEIFISIDGVLRNIIQKIEYHYNDFYINSIVKDELSDNFEYLVKKPIYNDNLLEYFTFHSQTEFENFLFIEFPLEIFGHSNLSYKTVMIELNKLIYDNKENNFTLIGIDELGKSKPATLFFLSKNACLSNNIRFIESNNLLNEWNKCDIWITDNKKIIDVCPGEKKCIKFNTKYNEYFNNKIEINKITEINDFLT